MEISAQTFKLSVHLAIKDAKIESRKGDGVNRLVCTLGDNWIAFKRQKRQLQVSKNFNIGDNRSKSSDLLLEQLRIFSIETRHKKILDHVQYMFV